MTTTASSGGGGFEELLVLVVGLWELSRPPGASSRWTWRRLAISVRLSRPAARSRRRGWGVGERGEVQRARSAR